MRPAAAVGALVAAAVGVRVGLILLDWPGTNSDEATMGLMALHISQGRDLPLFFYGQTYMGSGEAWLAAALFVPFGPSLLALRVVLVAFYAAFLVAVWRLGEVLYGRRAATIGAVLLLLGSTDLLAEQLRASGSRVELLLAATVMAWLAVWLVLRGRTARARWQLAAAAGWGLAAGYGLWTDLLTVPWLLAMALLLAVCWRPPRPGWALAAVFAGLLAGGFPQVLHNARAQWGRDDAVTTVLNQRAYQAGAESPPLWRRLVGTVTVALPYGTGGAALARAEAAVPWPASATVATLSLAAWGVVLLGLLSMAAVPSLRDLIRARRAEARGPPALSLARVAVLAAAGLTIAVFATSPRAVYTPIASSRYLAGVLVATPVVVGVLGGLGRRWVGRLAVAALLLLFAVDTAGAYGEALTLRQQDPEQQRLVAALLDRGATRVWSDYWTCDRLVFESRERVVCAVLDDDLGLGNNRYAPYVETVRAAPSAPYLFPSSSTQARRLGGSGQRGEPLPGAYLLFPGQP
jgi:hypothetical protein